MQTVYYAECLESVTELKERIQYGTTSSEMRFYYFNKESGRAVNDGINFCSDLSENKLEVANMLSRHILSDMEADLELQIRRLESCLWDKFRYTEDTVPEKNVK
ncbi:hypothetical protein [Phascolarctobacterium sp.]